MNFSAVPDNMSFGQLKYLVTMADMMADVNIVHSLAILSDGVANHKCGEAEDEDISDAPKFDTHQVEVYLAYEHASLSTFRAMRQTLIHQGYPVEPAVSTDMVS